MVKFSLNILAALLALMIFTIPQPLYAQPAHCGSACHPAGNGWEQQQQVKNSYRCSWSPYICYYRNCFESMHCQCGCPPTVQTYYTIELKTCTRDATQPDCFCSDEIDVIGNCWVSTLPYCPGYYLWSICITMSNSPCPNGCSWVSF